MTQTKQKSTRTTMYSVEDGRVVTHHLPWPKDSPKFEQFKERGFSFERPREASVEPPLVSSTDAPVVPVMSPADRMAKARAARKAKAGKV